jgi:hypothetical protein
MTPTEFKNLRNDHRAAFFNKFPQPGKGPRGFWRDSIRHAENACRDNDWTPETFDAAAEKIKTG